MKESRKNKKHKKKNDYGEIIFDLVILDLLILIIFLACYFVYDNTKLVYMIHLCN